MAVSRGTPKTVKHPAYGTTKPGNGNIGPSGARFGATLAEEDKAALLEHLKRY
ncbi:MAG TPA: hypothetical protein VMR62_16370 [Bryobacteraceae bacterium]|nr:hypothetical protein [Bryobacteraceae bacterium]